jgi:hypothetical protein
MTAMGHLNEWVENKCWKEYRTKIAIAIATACPIAIGNNALATADLRFSCKPSASAKSHPIAGFSP